MDECAPMGGVAGFGVQPVMMGADDACCAVLRNFEVLEKVMQHCCLRKWFFGGDVQSWKNLQTAVDVKVAPKALADDIDEAVVSMGSSLC